MSLSANLIPIFVIICFAGAFITAIVGKRIKGFPDAVGILATLSLLVCSVFSLQAVSVSRVIVYTIGAWKPPVGISLVMDGLTAFMLFTVNLVAALIAVYASAYMEHYTGKWKFYTLFLLMLGGMNGVLVTGDIFNLYVFLEIASLASFALVAFGTQKTDLEAAFKYTVMSTLGSLFMLFAIVLLYSLTSTLNMADMAAMIGLKGKTHILLMITVLFIMGFGLKAALVPFHSWLPDAHPAAPAPISAMLSGILIKSLGIYTLTRIFFCVLGVMPAVGPILMSLATVSMLLGGVLAVGQWDIKRLLAYSSISQMGYILFGLTLGTPLGILGALLHLFNHSVMKSLLFLNAGALEYAAGTRDLRELEGGLMARMPVSGITTFMGGMSISGVPPFAGFWSKLLIILAAIQAGHSWNAFVAILASVLTLAAVLKTLRYSFWGALPEKWKNLKEVPLRMGIPLGILALGCLFGGLLLMPQAREFLLSHAVEVITNGAAYAAAALKGM